MQAPVKTQLDVLGRLVSRARETQFGVENRFEALLASQDLLGAYQDSVPLQSYDDLEPYFTLARIGWEDMAWPGLTTRFAVSSGTVSKGKIIPATQTMLKTMRRCSLELLKAYMASTRRYDVLLGKFLGVSGNVNRDEEGALVGEMSGLVRGTSPIWFNRYWHAVDESVLRIDDWSSRLSAVASVAGGLDVRAIAMVPSWSVPLFEKLIDQYGRIERAGRSSVGQVWPNLRVFFSSGVPLNSYRRLLSNYLNVDDIHFVELYTASEGFFAFQDRIGHSDMLLHLDAGVFYEFVPMKEFGDKDARRLTIADVVPGEKYALYVTTCSGLWSYAVRDMVEFTTVNPHRIRVVGRTTEMLDSFGEALFAFEAREALDLACELHGAHVAYVHVTYVWPSDDQQVPQHEWAIEFVNVPDGFEMFCQTLDALLCTSNRHYQIRREADALKAPLITCLRRGAVERWLSSARDRVSAQTKLPFMSESRHIMNQLKNQ